MGPSAFRRSTTTSRSLPLPLVFVHLDSLLVEPNRAGAELLQLPWTDCQPTTYPLVDLLGLSGAGSDGRGRAREQVERVVAESKNLRWGECVLLQYHPQGEGGERSQKAEVLAFSSGEDDEEDSATLVFLRPATLHLPSLDTTARAHASSSSPTMSSTSFADSVYGTTSSASFAASTHPPSSNSRSSAPYSTASVSRSVPAKPSSSSPGSSGSNSSGVRRTHRVVATGEARSNLPVDPAVKQLLANATQSISERTVPTSSHSRPSVLASPSLSDTSSIASTSPSLSTASMPSPALSTASAQSSSSNPSRPRLPPRTDTSSTIVPNGPSSPASPLLSGRELTPEEAARMAEHVEPLHNQLRALGGGLTDAEQKAAEEADGRKLRPALPVEWAIAAIETIPEVVFLASISGEVLWMSSAWNRLVGTDPRFLQDEGQWLSTFHPDDLAQALAIYGGALQTQSEFQCEYRVKNEAGVYRWQKLHGRPWRDEEGVVQRFMCTISDVEELVSTRHDALNLQKKTKAVLENSALTLISVDAGTLLVKLCEGQRPTFMSAEDTDEIVGRRFEDVWDGTVLREAMTQILEEEVKAVEVDGVAIDAQGKRHYHRYRLVPLVGDPSIPSSHPDAQAITSVVIVARETTELVLAEERLNRTREETAEAKASELAAKEANRLKTEFLTTVSHEIRTPIASILGICELLLGDQLSVEQRSLVEKAMQSGENLLDLVGTVLDVRKVETGELQLEQAPFLISDIVDDARVFKVGAERKGLAFVEDIQPFFGGLVLADRLRLRQILANALSNAVKFTSTGTISLHLRQVEENDSNVTVEFIVEDSGVGISKDVLPTLFVPFRQADASTARQFGGSGLGLTIARKLVELMDGSVTLTSPGAGLGSRMTIIVPLTKAPTDDAHPSPSIATSTATTLFAPSQAPTTPMVPIERTRKAEEVKVLLAEDNPLIREIVSKTLRKMKFSIFAVNDGRECVEQVEKGDYDVILMDGQMPVMDGYAATAAIRKHPDPRIRKLRIIALTASAISGDEERCLESGMDGYLAKPVRAKELEAAIWHQVDIVEARRTAQ